MSKDSLSHSMRQDGEIAKVVLMPGDPLRAQYVAEHFLEDTVCFNTVRNMLGFTGTYKGKRISVMGSGMGIPSITLYANELYGQFGVDTIIRIGSTGATNDDVAVRDVIAAQSASTDSAYADRYDFPGYLAPTASFDVLSMAVESAKELGIELKVGPVFSGDHFYYPANFKDQLRSFGILCVEMETAGLYWTAMELGKKAMSLLTVSDHLFTGEELCAAERQVSFHNMMKVALETAWKTLD